MKVKRVSFNNIIETKITYSSDEYDRYPIDSILYRKAYGRVSNDEFNYCLLMLDLYKIYEMVVHSDSFKNNSYYKKTQEIFKKL